MPSESHRPLVAIALSLLLAVFWLLTHRYQGLSQDARIYAFQALARLDPALEHDLYLQNTSQDRYTLFSPFYAVIIRLLGLQSAARTLSVSFAVAFLAAGWRLARELLGREAAWLSVGALILTVGAYGSRGVFHFSEDYLSARSAAEAMIAIALAVYFGGHRRTGLSVAAGALLIHPLMALPGALLLIFLLVGTRMAVVLAVGGIALAGCLAMTSSILPGFRHSVPIMDAAWLDVVTERSQFLFVQLWSPRDWEVNLRPFASLGLSALVLRKPSIASLCGAAALVGGSGLLLALVAGTVGPVALLVQGQAWRWIWISGFIAAILMPATAVRLWQNERIGAIDALLITASWTLSAGDAPLLAPLALVSFLVRGRFTNASSRHVDACALVIGLALLCWDAVAVMMPAFPGFAGGGAHPPVLQRTDILAACRYPLILLLLVTWRWLLGSRSNLPPACLSIALGAACVFLVPVAFGKTDVAGSTRAIAEFADWRSAIPPSANVYVANGHDAAPFAWFTLQRPNYLSLDQSAGVVFSRATALEVRRRSAVLLPLMDEDWKLLSKNRAVRSGEPVATPRLTPLTATMLVGLCSDPELDFLIAREHVGFDPVRHEHPGPWLDWNLYSCEHVRSKGPAG